MIQKIKLGFLVSAAAFSSVAFAAPYGSAGCGLGSMVFEGNSAKWAQVLAATTNGTSGTQTFGISTGTSNCPLGTTQASLNQKNYIVANYSALQREGAQGSGQTLEGLASVMGCGQENFSAFAAHVQQNYDVVFANQDPENTLNAIRSGMSRSDFSVKCAPTI